MNKICLAHFRRLTLSFDKVLMLSLLALFYSVFCFTTAAMVVLSNIVIFMSLVQIIHSLNSCQQTFEKHKYDLNRLNHLTLSGDDGEFRYVLTPCGLVPTDKCGKSGTPFEKGMMACQERIATSSFESAMGFLDGYGKTPNLEFVENSQGPGTGVL